MISRTKFHSIILVIFLAIAATFFIGCDDRNQADIPPQTYVLSGAYTVGSVIRHVAVDGNTAAIAASRAGAIVLDVTNPGSITELYRYAVPDFARVEKVVLSESANLVGCYMPADASDPIWGQGPVWNYAHEDSFVTGMGMSGPLTELLLVADLASIPQTLTFWGADLTDSDGLVGSRLCRDSSEERWSTQCSFTPPPYVAPHGDIRGFGLQGDLMALANNNDGLHIENIATNTGVADFMTPGLPYDCAWFGNYIIVADRYFVTIIDATDPENPSQAANLIIDGADRLINVEVDDHYAILLDEFDGVYVVDLSEISDPQMVQEIRLNEPSSIRAVGGRLYVTDEQAGLLIYTRQ